MAESFGELLRRFRIAASLTQEALAQECRISPATVAAIEQGRRGPGAAGASRRPGWRAAPA
jgi:transcriptional regulator with XRE-family HTH domain